jgi:hypothetical protein
MLMCQERVPYQKAYKHEFLHSDGAERLPLLRLTMNIQKSFKCGIEFGHKHTVETAELKGKDLAFEGTIS